jgi:diguanylate cyclase (GGDEF)-like protein
MKTARVNGVSRPGMGSYARAAYLQRTAQRKRLAIMPVNQGQVLAQVKELQDALESSRQETIATRRQADRLAEANARLEVIAAQREAEIAKVRHYAYHDELTGLPNRALLLDRLNQALVRAKRQQTHLALFLLDLDGFKAINDRLGHAAGDKLLQRVAERLRASIRGGDTACRYGGDEFVLLLPDVDDEEHALEVARKIHARLAKPYRLDDHSIAVTASIGVAVYPVDGMSQGVLIDRADFAMYRAKTVNSAARTRARMVATR